MRILDILIPVILFGLWLMPVGLPKKIWGLFRGEIQEDDEER
jgi:hypothetical protein